MELPFPENATSFRILAFAENYFLKDEVDKFLCKAANINLINPNPSGLLAAPLPDPVPGHRDGGPKSAHRLSPADAPGR